jgi:O-methyltransferase
MSGHAPTRPHESTIQALDPRYPQLPSGGYCIVDNYDAVKGCERVITDYRAKNGVMTEIIDLDGTSAMWRKR